MSTIYFKYSTGPYGWMHNFSKYPIRLGGIIYPTSEHLYQAMKFFENSAKWELIASKPTPKSAKVTAYAYQELWIKEWDDIKLHVMEKILREKLSQHPDLKNLLLETGESEIVEDSSFDNYWGNGPNKNGQNHLGKLWMKLRSELKENK